MLLQQERENDIILRAVALAHQIHGTQCRKVSLVPETPYESHLWEVAALVMACGGDEELVAAALLHDGPEDHGRETRRDIREQCGPKVLQLVDACTEQGTGQGEKAPWYERKNAYLCHVNHVPLPVFVIIVADKLQNGRETLRKLRWVAAHQNDAAFDDIWSQFRGGREGTIWFHRRLLQIMQQRLRQFQQECATEPLLKGVEGLLDEFATVVQCISMQAEPEATTAGVERRENKENNRT